MPMYHAFGSNVTAFTTLHAGGKVVMLPNFEPEAFIKYMEQYKVRTGEENLPCGRNT